MTGARLDTGDADAYSGRFSWMREMSVSTGSTRTEKSGLHTLQGCREEGRGEKGARGSLPSAEERLERIPETGSQGACSS